MLPASAVLSAPQVQAAPLSIDDLHALASTTAREYGLNAAHFIATIQCESGFNPTATSSTDDFGIAQINAKAHPEISLGQADDPAFALDWMAQEWDAGNASEWVCWQMLYGGLQSTK